MTFWDDMAILPRAMSSPRAVIMATSAFLRISSSSMCTPMTFRSAPWQIASTAVAFTTTFGSGSTRTSMGMIMLLSQSPRPFCCQNT